MFSQAEIDSFVRTWFQGLNEHIHVERMLPLVVDDGLEMVFPEQTLHSHADFRDWYAAVGENFTDQDHEVEAVTSHPAEGGVALDVTVVWRAVQTADGTPLAMRAQQSWFLDRAPMTGAPRIVTYQVHSLDELQRSRA